MSAISETLLVQAEAWLADDPDPETRGELRAVIDAATAGDTAAAADLADRFAGRLEFGTAGLRGALGAGPNRMNRAVVSAAAAGLATYLNARGGGAVVIGYDARRNSDVFARDTAEIMTGAGLAAMVLPHPLPTPVLAYAIRHLGCAAGVMVTASHNPPQDNGYKVYLGDGSQIVPPADTEIAACIEAVGPVSALPRGEEWDVLGDAVLDAYLDRAASLVRPGAPRDLAVAYTAMHGVGGQVVVDAFTRAGFAAPVLVGAQFAPDPAFPTVAFPNPEEPGAIDLALATAREAGVDLVLANDPDADRCAVAAPMRDGSWRMLRGDEVGVLLGLHLIGRGERGIYANSIVSSSMLGAICRDEGLEHLETLTGFKWIGRVDGLSFGYEEALGYCVDPRAVRDKDGVTAALLVAELAAEAKSRGETVEDLLEAAAVRYGLHATDQLAVRVTDLSLIGAAMTRLRDNPPTSLGGRAVERLEDLERGEGGLPPTDGLRLTLADRGRVIVRPSGTEPKIKCYLEVVVPVAAHAPRAQAVADARAEADRALAALKADVAAAAGL